MTACGSDNGSTNPGGNPGGNPGATSAVGSYTITTINGKGLPVAVASDTGGYTYEVTAGTISLTNDGKYSVVTNYRQTITDNVSLFRDSTGGTWTQNGTSVSFTNGQDGSMDTATWSSAGQLTFTETGGPTTMVFVYALKKN